MDVLFFVEYANFKPGAFPKKENLFFTIDFCNLYDILNSQM